MNNSINSEVREEEKQVSQKPTIKKKRLTTKRMVVGKERQRTDIEINKLRSELEQSQIQIKKLSEVAGIKEEKPKRHARIPMTGRDVLKAPPREGYYRRWLHDIHDGERIKRFQEAGYTIVLGDFDTGDTKLGTAKVGMPITRSAGGGKRIVLMEIKEEYHKEDEEAKQRKIDEIEKRMQRKKTDAKSAGADGMYGEVKIERLLTEL